MSDKKLSVVAKMTAKPDKVQEVKAALLALIEPTREEEDCIEYRLHQSREDEGLFFFYEKWTSKEALDSHLAKAHLQDFLSKADDLLDSEVDIALLDEL